MTKAVTFEERMSGWIAFGEPSYNQALAKGRKLRQSWTQQLTIEIDDIDSFLVDRRHEAGIKGSAQCDALGGGLRVTQGWFNLFVRHGSARHRRMLYRLFLLDGDDNPLTMSGFKDVQHGPYVDDGWGDTSRLLIRVFRGHLGRAEEPDGDEQTLAAGILHVTVGDFARLYVSMQRRAGLRGALAAAKFDRFFAKRIADYYVRDLWRPAVDNDPDWPSPTYLDPRWQGYPPEQWHDLPGRPGYKRRIVGFQTEDGRHGTLHNIRAADADGAPEGGPVMLAHGCSVRANMFYGAPTRQTIVSALVDAGYDVWAENWRASIDLPASMWTLDHGAVYDHPAAVRKVVTETGWQKIKAIIHCQGSTSFMMAALAGLVPQVTHVVSNAVSLHVKITRLSHLRLRYLVPAIPKWLIRGVDPQWAVRAPAAFNSGFARLAASRGGKCDSDVCRAANWFYGVGGEVLWHHANLDDATHSWNNREWGFCPTTFFEQMAKCADKGYLVPTGQVPGLPEDLLGGNLETEARFTFIAGRDNICFLPESQRLTFEYFDRCQPGRHHRMHELPGYCHLDVFIGAEADRNVYPLILDGLK